MKVHTATWPALIGVAMITLLLGACATTEGQNPASVDGPTASNASQSNSQYLYNLMQQPAYAAAFTSMDGSSQLPGWVRTGGTSIPTRTVQIDGQSYLAAQACKPHACAGQQVILLYNKADSTMRGVFVNDPAPTPNVGISDQAELTLLGHPDAAVKAWLKHELTTG